MIVKRIILSVTLLLATTVLHAQHTFGVMGGYGTASEAIYPAVTGRTMYGLPNAGVSWRTYSSQQVVGCFGLDLQYIQRGFSFSPYTSTGADDETVELDYYTRKINTLMVPIVWQPHFYMLERRVRVFFEAAVTFSYDFSSTYNNDYARQLMLDAGGEDDGSYGGKYDYMTARDNRFGYGLAGGGGLALLLGRIEILARARYYFGLSDVVRNRNKYYSNMIDGSENPFSTSPVRSSINNFIINFGVNYHFGPEGFASWDVKKVKAKIGRTFDYKGEY